MPSQACGEIVESGLTKDEQDTVVRLHNVKRAKVANGDETKGRKKKQPEAANMMELVKYSVVYAVYFIREKLRINTVHSHSLRN